MHHRELPQTPDTDFLYQETLLSILAAYSKTGLVCKKHARNMFYLSIKLHTSLHEEAAKPVGFV